MIKRSQIIKLNEALKMAERDRREKFNQENMSKKSSEKIWNREK